MIRPVTIETRRAGPDAGTCPVCLLPIEAGRRIVLVRGDSGAHTWIHVRHLAEPADAGP